MTESPERLFVYGSLMAGLPGAHELARTLAASASLEGWARVQGRLWDVGQYPGQYPGLTLDGEHDDQVFGQLWRLSSDAATRLELWTLLDAYEGCAPGDPEPQEYARVYVEVQGLDPDECTRSSAQLYVYRRPLPARATRIVDGRWPPKA